MTSKTFTTGTVIDSPWLNDVNTAVYDPTFVSVFQYLSTAQIADVRAGTALLDVTTAIQTALTASSRVYFPAGVYLVNTNTGLKFRTGQVITGAGKNKTVLTAILGNGATAAELAAYTKGSVFKRRFNPSTNVTGVTWTIPVYTSTDGVAQTFRIFNQSVTDHSAKTVTITGTDSAGAVQSEVLALPQGTGGNYKAYSVKKYLTVTSLVPSATIGADTMAVCLENPYVNDVYISDIGVVLNHDPASITTTTIQIGFDMRNVSISAIERCHVGNIPPVGGALTKSYTKPFAVQGYPVVFGNTSSSDPAYSGGEKNRLVNNSVYGGYKCVIQDDSTLSLSSASYGTIIKDNDIQTGHWLIGQMGQYGGGNLHTGNILQDIQKQSGSVATSYVQYYAGYNNFVSPTYVESGSNVDYQLYLETTANNNKIVMLMASFSSGTGLITDNSSANSYNRITYYGTDGVSPLIELYNKAYSTAWVKFHYDGVSAIVIDGSSGVQSVTRGSVGDYTITWTAPFASSSYNVTSSVDTDASAHFGGIDVRSHASNNVRVVTFTQVAGVTTQIDPRFVWVGANQ